MPRYQLAYSGPTRAVLVQQSGNTKTGEIPVSLTSADTCPTTCPWWGNGCYSENTHVANRWGRLHAGLGLSWDLFCRAVSELPEGQLWRHNEAGDLPGAEGHLDSRALRVLVEANAGRRGFTYTHKPMSRSSARRAVQHCNDNGFTVNLSADSLAEADALADLGIGPVVVTLRPGAGACRTPAGRRVVVCPAQLRPGEVFCSSCGVCQQSGRDSVVGFRVHGLRMRQAEDYARRHGLPKPERRPVDMRLVRWPYEHAT